MIMLFLDIYTIDIRYTAFVSSAGEVLIWSGRFTEYDDRSDTGLF
jgi:hypothetical protein